MGLLTIFDKGGGASAPAFQTSGAFNLTSPSWFNADEGTFIVEFTDVLTNTSTDVVFSLTDGSTNNRIEFLHPAYATDGRTLTAMDVGGAAKINNIIGNGGGANRVRTAGTSKLAVAYKDGDTVFYLNGVPVGRNISEDIPTVNRVAVGSRAGGSLPFDGTIGKVEYYSSRKPDTFLEAKTSGIPVDLSTSYDSGLNSGPNIIFFLQLGKFDYIIGRR